MSVWACFVSVAVCSFFAIVAGIGYILFGTKLTGVAILGAGIACLGLSIFLFCACKIATHYTMLLAKQFFVWIKKAFTKKEVAQ